MDLTSYKTQKAKLRHLNRCVQLSQSAGHTGKYRGHCRPILFEYGTQ